MDGPLGAGNEITPVVHMVGSSTERDLQDDTMLTTALADMMNIRSRLSVWLNHDYSLPDSLFGSITGKPSVITAGGVADLHLNVEVEMDNPAAARTYKYIRNGRLFGCSVGCMVLDWDMDRGSDSVLIKHVEVVEFSVVGIPANQRCWVENAIKGVFSRSLRSERYEDVERLAPAMKGLFPRDYESLINRVDDFSLRKQLHGVKARPANQRLMWMPARKTFVLVGVGSGSPAGQEVTATQIPTILATKGLNSTPKVEPLQATPEVDLRSSLLAAADALEPDLDKGACGKTSWPLASRDLGWDGSGARHRLVEWAGGKDNLSASKMQQVFFWFDASASDTIGAYKMPFCDVIGGSVKAIPRGVFAAAASVQGARSAPNVPSGDLAGIRSKISTYYHRMAQAFNDPDIVAPWDGGKDVDPDMFKAIAPYDDYRDYNPGESQGMSGTAELPERHDDFRDYNPDGAMGSMTPASGPAPKPSIAPGSAPWSGVQPPQAPAPVSGPSAKPQIAPRETQGMSGPTSPDVTETPSISENADAMQSKPVSKDMTPAEMGNHEMSPYERSAMPDADGDFDSDVDHGPFSGFHTHVHKAFGHGESVVHAHEHYHESDGHHAHSHQAMHPQHPHMAGLGWQDAATKSVEVPASVDTPPVEVYKASDGLEITREGTHASHKGAHSHKHKAFGSQGDDETHEHSHTHDGDSSHKHSHVEKQLHDDKRSTLLRAYNELGMTLGFPTVSEVTRMGVVSSLESHIQELRYLLGVEQVETASLSVGEAILKALHITKAGKEFSKENFELLQRAHDAISDMTESKMCSARVSAVGNSRQGSEDLLSAEQSAAMAMDREPPIAPGPGISNSLSTLSKSLDRLDANIQAKDAAQQLRQLRQEFVDLQQQIEQVKQTGLGRPTNFTDRSITVAEVIEPKLVQVAGLGACKHWLSGDPTKRPTLTLDQMSLMSPYQIEAYREGQEVLVPVTDNE